MSEFDETVNGNRTEGIIYPFLCEKLNYFETTYGIFLKEWFIIIVDFIISVNTDFLNFDDFQLKILKVFLIFLVINIILIVFLWNTYRDRIYERFIQPAPSCIIEELRKSVSQLKLPRGHSPRI